MPNIKITHEVRKQIIADLLHGKTKKDIAAEHEIQSKTITEDQKRNLSIWKSEAVAIVAAELEREAEQLMFAARHLQRRAFRDSDFTQHLTDANFSLSTLDNVCKRVRTLFKEKGKRHAEAEAQ